MKVTNFIKFILKEMERQGLKQWEAEYVAKHLGEELKRNHKRLKDEKPFVVAKKS